MPNLNSDLTFIEETHEYFLGLKRLPSVSEIMKPLTELALSYVPQRQLEVARDRGIKVHQAIEDYIKFDLFDEEVGNYLDQFILMLVENDLQVIESELRLTDGEYAGTLDLIVKDTQNRLGIIDTKTTYSIAKYVGVQLAAYELLAKHNSYDIKWTKIFHVKEDWYELRTILPDTEKWRNLLAEYQNAKDQYFE